MNKFSYFILVYLIFVACGKTNPVPATSNTCPSSFSTVGDAHPHAAELNALMDTHLEVVVGLQVAITDAAGNHWSSARGFADIWN